MRDSNPRYALGVYTLSRRASSTTRASLPFTFFLLKLNAFHPLFLWLTEFSATNVFFFFRLHTISLFFISNKNQKLINFKTFEGFTDPFRRVLKHLPKLFRPLLQVTLDKSRQFYSTYLLRMRFRFVFPYWVLALSMAHRFL